MNKDSDKNIWLAEQFEAQRPHLRAVAYRMLGSLSEAEDAVQESWLHVSRAGVSNVQNLGGWLTTVVARVCLDMLRSRNSRREDLVGEDIPEPGDERQGAVNPEEEAVLADSVGLALLVVLNTLNPAERLAFVLHDIFDVPFDEIAPIVERTPEATRQLASRARRRVRGTAAIPEAELAPQREVADAFLAASRSGDFAGLLAVLDPDVVFRSDPTAAANAPREMRGADAIARLFAGRARAAQTALVDGTLGIVVVTGGQLRLVLRPIVKNGKIAEIEAIMDPARLSQMEVAVLGN